MGAVNINGSTPLIHQLLTDGEAFQSLLYAQQLMGIPKIRHSILRINLS